MESYFSPTNETTYKGTGETFAYPTGIETMSNTYETSICIGQNCKIMDINAANYILIDYYL
jgi:hypothetical protein